MTTEQNETQGQASDQAQGEGAGAAAAADPQSEVARLQGERRELNDRLLRLAADFENYKKRIRREMDEAGLRGMEGLLKEVLPVLDNLDRAIDAGTAAAGGTSNALLDGVRLVQKQFLTALEKSQVKTFEALGKPFDPNVHEAVQQVEHDSLQPGTVATVFQRGYTAAGRLLRPAMVAVVRPRAQEGGGAGAGPGAGTDDAPRAELN